MAAAKSVAKGSRVGGDRLPSWMKVSGIAELHTFFEVILVYLAVDFATDGC